MPAAAVATKWVMICKSPTLPTLIVEGSGVDGIREMLYKYDRKLSALSVSSITSYDISCQLCALCLSAGEDNREQKQLFGQTGKLQPRIPVPFTPPHPNTHSLTGGKATVGLSQVLTDLRTDWLVTDWLIYWTVVVVAVNQSGCKSIRYVSSGLWLLPPPFSCSLWTRLSLTRKLKSEVFQWSEFKFYKLLKVLVTVRRWHVIRLSKSDMQLV